MRRMPGGRICFYAWLSTVIFMGMLSGCDMRSKKMMSAGSQKLPYKVETTSDSERLKMQAKLNQQGATVITMGQDYLISIPSSALFANHSPRILWGSYPLLNDVACYLKQFRKINVNITGFSNKCAYPKRECALTLARSQTVGNYLWSQNIDSRFIFTHGLGSDKPIVTNNQGNDRLPSSRIEITFRNAVV